MSRCVVNLCAFDAVILESLEEIRKAVTEGSMLKEEEEEEGYREEEGGMANIHVEDQSTKEEMSKLVQVMRVSQFIRCPSE